MQGYRAIRREINERQREFDRQPMTLTPLRIARFTALDWMYDAALLVAARANEARLALPEGAASWADEIVQLERLSKGNVQRARDAGWSAAPRHRSLQRSH